MPQCWLLGDTGLLLCCHRSPGTFSHPSERQLVRKLPGPGSPPRPPRSMTILTFSTVGGAPGPAGIPAGQWPGHLEQEWTPAADPEAVL